VTQYTTGPGFSPEALAAMWSILVVLALLAFRSQWRLPFAPRPRLRPLFASGRRLRRGVGGTVVEPADRYPVPTEH
jgi:hypothetical protein